MILLILTALLQQADPPQKPNRLWRDFEFQIGGYYAGVDTTFDVKGENGIGGKIDAEDLLGLDSSVLSARLSASVALADRHRIHFDCFDLSRSASKRIGRDIEFGDTVYPIGSDVDTRFGLQMFDLTYGYSFLQDDRMDLAVTFGIHGLRTHIRLDAANLGMEESERFFLPVPLPGLRMDFALTPSLWLRQKIELLWLGADSFAGLVTDFSINLEYAFIEHVAVGIGYNALRMKLRMEDQDFPAVDFQGSFDFDFAGLQLYVSYFF